MPDRLPDRSEPLATYRLQLTADFGFAQAGELAAYLADLGVSHVYLSPILEAVPGSGHGYDVTDHSRIRAEFGGEDGFRAMARKFRDHGLGLVVDIVPNHMAVHEHNRQLWDVLAHGQESGYAHWFDIDWAAGDGRFLLPILDDTTTDDDFSRTGDTLWYRGMPLPRDDRHYRLAHWRTANTELNWRRFFDVTSLIGIRQEDPRVFEASHEVLFGLIDDGLVDGLRVDHPDGLADPRGYLEQLASRCGWVVAEKILERGERLPSDWRCAGTTGYDALALVDGLFIDPAGAPALTALVHEPTFAQVAHQAKHEVTERLFPAEVARVTRLWGGQEDVSTVLTELLAAFPVYRAYVHPGEPASAQASHAMSVAANAAKPNLPRHLHDLADTLCEALLGKGDGSPELITRFQQTTGPVLAKGIEDTASYRWPRLLALNEVGSDPDRFGVAVAEFHAEAARLAEAWPLTMTTLSTHDTKRQEDVRARLAVLAELPPSSGQWSPSGTIDAATEYLVWQTLVGAWPIDDSRLAAYLTKAIREAKTHTSWTDPVPAYEQAVLDFARAVPKDEIASIVAKLAPYARVNSLGAKLVQLTMPGVPDVYQGCELGGFALVDPDNRRPVDHVPRTDLDREKLLITKAALHCRRDHPGWFRGAYTPLTADGPGEAHVIAFARGEQAVTVATRLPAGLHGNGGWQTTTLNLPGTRWRDVLTGTTHHGDRLGLADLTRTLPVALLVPEP